MEHITSRTNPLMVRVKKLRDDRKFRRSEGLFLCDGVKMLEEAVRWHAAVQTVVLSDGVRPENLPEHVRLVSVPEDVMRSISPMESPQGVLFLVRIPDLTPPDRMEGRRYLILDGLQDPGNVGTIWRTADAFGCAGLLLTHRCADPFSPKTVRASMGAAFRTPVWEIEAEAISELCARSELKLKAAALGKDAVPLQRADLSRAAVVIGSEGNGVSPALLACCDETVRIPMDEKCESLNAAVAAAVVLWECRRRDLS